MSVRLSLYDPREDSFLLAEQVAKHARGTVLDVGCGSGIQARTAAKLRRVKSVLAVDIQPGVITHCKKTLQHPKVSYRVSDLFKRTPERFDTVLFNPPYLPNDATVTDVALDGGKLGSELLERFIRELPEHLTERGQALIVFSTLTKPKRVHAAIADALLEYELLASERVFFEELIVYRLTKNALRQQFERMGVRNLRKLTHGHRGAILIGDLTKRQVAIKVQRLDSPAKGTVTREGAMLRKLNAYGIGPTLLRAGMDWFIYQYIPGTFIAEWVEQASRPAIVRMLRAVLRQMRTLDELGITKEEMHHPHKHVIVDRRGKPWLVDFERAHRTEKPKNVTQFCQYLRSGNFNALLGGKGIPLAVAELTGVARAYGRDPSDRNYKDILRLIRIRR